MSLVGKFIQVYETDFTHYRIGQIISSNHDESFYLVKFEYENNLDNEPSELYSNKEMISSHAELGKYWLFFDNREDMMTWIGSLEKLHLPSNVISLIK
jgi:hypothetical protein